METKVAVVAVVVEDRDSVERLNEILHDYADYIIGRNGNSLPREKDQYHQRGG